MNFAGKKIGIWGYGIVGKSLIKYLSSKNNIFLSVIEKRKFTKEEIECFKERNIAFYDQNLQLSNFLNDNDYIIPSPGIDLVRFKQFEHKWLCELDLFYANFNKPIIAVTGTVGKTTITYFIEQLLQKNGKNIIAAGNIGLGMCDLIEKQDELEGVILEVSSFQLEYTKLFAPSLAIWTNFFPNHLDRHGNLENYFQSKSKIFLHQNNQKIVLLPVEIAYKVNKNLLCQINYFSLEKPSDNQMKEISNFNNIFFIQNNFIVKMNKNFEIIPIIDLNKLPEISYKENWIVICAALYLYGLNLNFENVNLNLPEHRLERFATIKNVDFYNDSKSTIPDATLAAVSKLKGKPIILFLGGISKGVDRSSMLTQLKNNVKYVICFGGEAQDLKKLCELNNIESSSFNDLESSVEYCFKLIQSNDQVLFSPSGASFDLFTNYSERGKRFKELVNNLNK